MDRALQLAQEEIWQLNDWTLKSRIKFEPNKTHMLAIHRNPAKRRAMKKTTIYLDRLQQQPLQWTEHVKLLGITFSENGTFHKHLNKATNKSLARIKQLKKFAGIVKNHTLYKVYKTAIQPIAIYGNRGSVQKPHLYDTKKTHRNGTCSY